MHGLLKRLGYRLYPLDSPEAVDLLAEQGLGPADLDHALAGLERSEGTAVRTVVGMNEDGVFGTRRSGWHPELPDAHGEPFIPLSGSRSTSCSAACPPAAPRGSSRTARCRTGPRAEPPSTGWPAEASNPKH